jgi:hypothetical protein
LLTHFAAEKRHIGLETFNKLVQAQSRAYQRYQEVLAVCSDPRVILDSLIVLREDGKGGTFDQWMDVLRKLL